MGLGRFFSKIKHGADNVFHKINKGGDTFFNKTVPGVTNKVGGVLDYVGNKSSEIGRKLGNTLEKNAGILSGIGSGLAVALGQPELVPLIAGAGLSAQQLGSNIKSGSAQIKNYTDNAKAVLGSKSNQFSNRGQSLLQNTSGRAQQGLNSGLSQAQSLQNNVRSAVQNGANQQILLPSS